MNGAGHVVCAGSLVRRIVRVGSLVNGVRYVVLVPKLTPALPFCYVPTPTTDGVMFISLQVNPAAFTKVADIVEQHMSLACATKVLTYVDGKLRVLWVSDTKTYVLRGEDIASLVATHLDGGFNVVTLARTIRAGRGPGRPRKNKPGLVVQPPEASAGVNPVSG